MDNNRTKTINNIKPYYYRDIIYHLKNENKDIKKIENPTTKNIYKKNNPGRIKTAQNIRRKFMEKTPTKIGLPSNLEKYVHILCTAILHWPTLQIATLLNENKRIHASMHPRYKSKM